jgi:hypothetical protein
MDAQVCRAPSTAGTGSSPAREIPIQLRGGGVFVDIRLNGSGTFSFQIDSGFEQSAIDSTTAKRLNLPTTESHATTAPGGTIQTSRVEGVRRTLAGIPLAVDAMLVADFSGLAPFFAHRIDGVLGFDFFRQFVVILDYERERLSLCDPPSFSYRGNGTAVPIDLSTRQPYIRAQVAMESGQQIEASMEIDTGKVDPFSLNLAFAEEQHLLGDKSNLFALRGISLGGPTEAWIGRTRKLSWKGLSIIPLWDLPPSKFNAPVAKSDSGSYEDFF